LGTYSRCPIPIIEREQWILEKTARAFAKALLEAGFIEG
jgi:hypothetical protein